jgi:D-beta-D-heptose 7-phosphate kinase/D-beta-D-heptose 1-phosphate adenosyltransferase
VIVVVGDSLLDVDVEAAAGRFVPDSVAPVLDEVGRRERPGGAALTALLAAREDEVVLVTALPADAAGARVRELLAGRVRVIDLPARGSTAVKMRLRSGAHTVARLDQGGESVEVEALPSAAVDALRSAAVVLVSDYGRGVTHSPDVLRELAAIARQRPVVWDPHPRGGSPVPGTRVVTPNAGEAARALGVAAAAGVPDAGRQARELVRQWDVASVALTFGGRGAVLAVGDSTSIFPAPRAVTGDACGAGDRFASRVATALAGGALVSESIAAAVSAATEFLAAGGVATLDHDAAPEPQPVDVVAAVRASGGTVVATGGCFDLLHAGHVETLRAARSLGDCLVVCLNSDASVRRGKGEGRPLQSADDRRRVLEGIRWVDAVVVFDEDTPLEVLDRLRPDVWVKGGDYDAAALPETPLVRSWGGEVVTVPYLPGRSTTDLVGRARR